MTTRLIIAQERSSINTARLMKQARRFETRGLGSFIVPCILLDACTLLYDTPRTPRST